jgi:hypothetical protein
MARVTNATSILLWGLRGTTAYCAWCRLDTDHNTDWHRERLVKRGRA